MSTIRFVTLNIWGERGPLNARMNLIATGLRQLKADVVALQEVRTVPSVTENQAELLGKELGMNVHHQDATAWGNGVEGIAILSKFPIANKVAGALPHSTPEEQRVVIGSTLTTPHGSLSVFTTHHTYRLQDGAKREEQVQATEAFVAQTPSELPRVLMGDFNAPPDADEIRFLTGKHSLGGRRVYYQDAFARLHPADLGFTWARKNAYLGPLKWLDPDRRLDYIFVEPMRRDGRGTILDCRVVFDSAAPGGVFASDHFGVYAEVQMAANPEA